MKEQAWREFIIKEENQERSFKSIFKRLLEAQEEEVLGKLNSAQNVSDALFDEDENIDKFQR